MSIHFERVFLLLFGLSLSLMKENSIPNNMQFWKKLRLIKKCEHCREKGTHSLIISHNLIHKYNIINQKVYDTFSIDWYLKKSEAKKKFLKNDAPPEDSSLKKKIKQRYIQIRLVFPQLKYIVHYYRFYSYQAFITCDRELFQMLESHHNRKKMIQYNQIRQFFKSKQNKTPNQNMSTKLKTIGNTNERVLDDLYSMDSQQSQYNMLGIQDLGRSLQEIDRGFKFLVTQTSERKKIRSRGFLKKKNKDYHQIKLTKKQNKKDTNRNYKKNRKCNSCENFMTYPTPKGGNMSPNPLKKNFKQKKMNKWKNSDQKITSCPSEEIVKEYIMNLKIRINEEKKGLVGKKKEKDKKQKKEKDKRYQITEYYETKYEK